MDSPTDIVNRASTRPTTTLAAPIVSTDGTRRRKIRLSCDLCRATKVRCSQSRPSCHRCVAHHVPCVYGVSRQSGRPRPRLSHAVREGGGRQQTDQGQKHSVVASTRTMVQRLAGPPSPASTINPFVPDGCVSPQDTVVVGKPSGRRLSTLIRINPDTLGHDTRALSSTEPAERIYAVPDFQLLAEQNVSHLNYSNLLEDSNSPVTSLSSPSFNMNRGDAGRSSQVLEIDMASHDNNVLLHFPDFEMSSPLTHLAIEPSDSSRTSRSSSARSASHDSSARSTAHHCICHTSLIQTLSLLQRHRQHSTPPALGVILRLEKNARYPVVKMLGCDFCLGDCSSMLLGLILIDNVVLLFEAAAWGSDTGDDERVPFRAALFLGLVDKADDKNPSGGEWRLRIGGHTPSTHEQRLLVKRLIQARLGHVRANLHRLRESMRLGASGEQSSAITMIAVAILERLRSLCETI